MNACWDTRGWYKQDDLCKAVNLCLKAIEESGISAERAALIPDCLAQAIDCGNDMILSGTRFRSYQQGMEGSGFPHLRYRRLNRGGRDSLGDCFNDRKGDGADSFYDPQSCSP